MALQASCSDTLQHTRTENSPEGARAERDTTASMTSSSNLCSAHESDRSRLRRDPAERRVAETVPEEEEEKMEMSRRVRGRGGTLGKQTLGRWKEKEMFSVKENSVVILSANNCFSASKRQQISDLVWRPFACLDHCFNVHMNVFQVSPATADKNCYDVTEKQQTRQ